MAFRRKHFPGSRGAGFRASKTFKKKQFAWQYVELEETAINTAGAPTVDVILFDSEDWATTASNAENVKSVSMDLRIMFAWTPQSTTLAYDSWYMQAGIFVLDADDTGNNFSTTIAAHRALWWNVEGRNTGEQPAANGVSPQQNWMNWKVKRLQRFMKFDEELRFLCRTSSDVSGVIADARVSIFGRLSWETP